MYEQATEIIDALEREIVRPVTDWGEIGRLAARPNQTRGEESEATT